MELIMVVILGIMGCIPAILLAAVAFFFNPMMGGAVILFYLLILGTAIFVKIMETKYGKF